MANPHSVKKVIEDQEVVYLEDDIEADRQYNRGAQTQNPLAGISTQELEVQVDVFCDKFGFQDHLEVFRKAALVAQNPDKIESIESLTDEDRYWLQLEHTKRWKLPWTMYMCIGIVSIGSAIQGWDNTGANGANLSYPQEFGIAHRPWLIGVINAGPTLFGLLSAWAADPVNYFLGRRGTIFFTNLFVVFPVLAQAFTSDWVGLMICRLFMGLGMGIKISTIPVYSAEVSPASIRGGIVTSFQLWVAFGILIGFSSNLVFMDIGPLAWRFQLAAAFAPAVPLCFLIWLCPESPRWLMKKNRYQKAFRAFCRIRNTELIAARELFYAHCQISAEENMFEGKTLATRTWELFSVPRIRRATVSSAIIVISQQFSGVNIMAFYSSTIFSEAGYTARQALLASFGYGLIMFIFAIPAVYTMDTYGRRNLLLVTFPQMAWCLLAAGFCFLMPESNSARVPLIAFFVYLFIAFYGPGIGPIPSIYFSESFPLSHREIGAAFSICVNNSVGSALSLTFPSLLARVTPTGAFGFYAGLNVVAFLVIFFVVPETKKRTLEELDFVFGVPTTKHAAYQLKVWLPWWIRRYVFWQRRAVLEPFYEEDSRE
ncbi:MFS transporter [Hortaea werneckii]|uniref:Major facilitator superfamily (MFS) profile domain-containing protein n=1 Tax=Hortaea werneckii TaxID=91943 RepID=A0A3M7GIW7_HORWE|nr:MFS transporter [Hortaea werneckii]KAI7564556.1 MFS transporter [Hortaea werneckii]KAI7621463.1 MFS transporter [Hortaea werneckii]KAI7630564.1 MFS transporter [Hortaea werneckii]KAI7678120.1 MFS transporter [Hortaea werneckii]